MARRFWLELNRERQRSYGRNRRAAVRLATGSHAASDIDAIRAAQRNRCAYCKVRLGPLGGEIDHVVPLHGGGTNDRRNLQLLCTSCNRSKGAKHPVDHARRIGLLI